MRYRVKRHDFGKGWSLCTEEYKGGKTLTRYVKTENYPPEFKSVTDYEHAKKIMQSYNDRQNIVKQQVVLHRIQNRIKIDRTVQSAFLPPDVVNSFENIFFSRKEGKKLANAKSVWLAAKVAIAEVKMEPGDWVMNPDPVYMHFIDLKCSRDWANRVIACMNRYGHIYHRRRGGSFLQISKLKEEWITKVDESFYAEKPTGEKSEKLTLEMMMDLKRHMKEANWEWIYIAFWFGLRPHEVDLLHTPKDSKGFKIWFIENDVLTIDQPKLRTLPKGKRYKNIPIKYPEQKKAVELIQKNTFKRPFRKTFEKHFPEGVTLYGPRHGFTSLMDQRGHSQKELQSWLGHRHASTTERHYVDHGIIRK